ncbi:MAG: hypothetical protein HGA45_33765 [Chloroflexales bacterium]|nr:hypothetical protein [Chloroflexales bacterium]
MEEGQQHPPTTDDLATGLKGLLEQIDTYRDAPVPTILTWLAEAKLSHLREELELNISMDLVLCKRRLWDYLLYNLEDLEAFLGVLVTKVEGDERDTLDAWRVTRVRMLRRRKALLGSDEPTIEQIFSPSIGADDDDDVDYQLTECFADEIHFLAIGNHSRLTLRQFHNQGTSIVLGPSEIGKTQICRFLARRILTAASHRLLVIHCGRYDSYLIDLTGRAGDRMRLMDSQELNLDALQEFLSPAMANTYAAGQPPPPQQSAFIIFDHARDSELSVREAIQRLRQIVEHCLNQWARYGIACKLFFDSELFQALGQDDREALAVAPIYTMEAWPFEVLVGLFDKRLEFVFEHEHERSLGRTLTSAERNFLRQDGRRPNELRAMIRDIDIATLERRVSGRPGIFFKLLHDLFVEHCLSDEGPDDRINPDLLQRL